MDIFQRLFLVGDHHVRIFADNMDLLDALPVEVVKILVILFLIAASVVEIQAFKFNLVVQHHESAFDADYAGLRQKQQGFFNILNAGLSGLEKVAGIISFDKFGQ